MSHIQREKLSGACLECMKIAQHSKNPEEIRPSYIEALRDDPLWSDEEIAEVERMIQRSWWMLYKIEFE